MLDVFTRGKRVDPAFADTAPREATSPVAFRDTLPDAENSATEDRTTLPSLSEPPPGSAGDALHTTEPVVIQLRIELDWGDAATNPTGRVVEAISQCLHAHGFHAHLVAGAPTTSS